MLWTAFSFKVTTDILEVAIEDSCVGMSVYKW